MLPRFFSHLLRWPRSHGFGVQSPSAYRFVKDIIREQYPYYAYASLAKKYPEDKVAQAFHQFLLRLSNALQAQHWVSNNLKTVELDYLKAGCKSAELSTSHPHPDGVIIDLEGLASDSDPIKSFYCRAVDQMKPSGVMIIEGIHRNRSCTLFWQQVLADSHAVVTFDIYDCGVVFFDATKAKKNYKVMFSL
jgi:hypothetical protein